MEYSQSSLIFHNVVKEYQCGHWTKTDISQDPRSKAPGQYLEIIDRDNGAPPPSMACTIYTEGPCSPDCADVVKRPSILATPCWKRYWECLQTVKVLRERSLHQYYRIVKAGHRLLKMDARLLPTLCALSRDQQIIPPCIKISEQEAVLTMPSWSDCRTLINQLEAILPSYEDGHSWSNIWTWDRLRTKIEAEFRVVAEEMAEVRHFVKRVVYLEKLMLCVSEREADDLLPSSQAEETEHAVELAYKREYRAKQLFVSGFCRHVYDEYCQYCTLFDIDEYDLPEDYVMSVDRCSASSEEEQSACGITESVAAAEQAAANDDRKWATPLISSRRNRLPGVPRLSPLKIPGLDTSSISPVSTGTMSLSDGPSPLATPERAAGANNSNAAASGGSQEPLSPRLFVPPAPPSDQTTDYIAPYAIPGPQPTAATFTFAYRHSLQMPTTTTPIPAEIPTPVYAPDSRFFSSPRKRARSLEPISPRTNAERPGGTKRQRVEQEAPPAPKEGTAAYDEGFPIVVGDLSDEELVHERFWREYWEVELMEGKGWDVADPFDM